MVTGSKLYELFCAHPCVCTDTRRIEEGCIFFALKGANFDGNNFAQEALRLGAAYAVVDDKTLPDHPQLLRVPNTLEALQSLAREHRQRLSIPIIGITGTNGKTTTKELLRSVLSQTYSVLATEGNLNNHIGVPLTLLQMTQEHQIAIIEMGASKPGDIAELCGIALPNYGIITSIGRAHLEGFGSLEGVQSTKGELFDYLRSSGGIAFVREDDKLIPPLAKGLPSLTYGLEGSGATVVSKPIHDPSDTLYLSFSWSVPQLDIQVAQQATQLVGNYNLVNALCAITVGVYFDVPSPAIECAIAQYSPRNSRSQLIESPRSNRIIADSYNANPTSMQAALESFATIPCTSHRVAILGDMNELGQESATEHSRLHELATQLLPESQILYCGPIWAKLLGERPDTFASVESLAQWIEEHPIRESLVLIKGSNSIKLSSLTQYL